MRHTLFLSREILDQLNSCVSCSVRRPLRSVPAFDGLRARSRRSRMRCQPAPNVETHDQSSSDAPWPSPTCLPPRWRRAHSRASPPSVRSRPRETARAAARRARAPCPAQPSSGACESVDGEPRRAGGTTAPASSRSLVPTVVAHSSTDSTRSPPRALPAHVRACASRRTVARRAAGRIVRRVGIATHHLRSPAITALSFVRPGVRLPVCLA